MVKAFERAGGPDWREGKEDLKGILYLLRVRICYLEPHEEFGLGADGHAEGVLRWGGSGIAGVGDSGPASCQERLAPLRAVGDAADSGGLGETVKQAAAALLHLR